MQKIRLASVLRYGAKSVINLCALWPIYDFCKPIDFERLIKKFFIHPSRALLARFETFEKLSRINFFFFKINDILWKLQHWGCVIANMHQE